MSFSGKFTEWFFSELRLFAKLTLVTVICTGIAQSLPKPSPRLPAVLLHHSGWRHATASWYGPGFFFHRKKNGRIYHRTDVFVASSSLPMGTVVWMVNLRNGRNMRLRVEDRAPGFEGREFDLSEHAAERLGMRSAGVVHVRYLVLSYP